MTPRFILALSGGIGVGKSTLSEAVAKKLGWALASFGSHVRHLAEINGRDANDRGELQRLGQALVLTNVGGFIDAVLAQAKDERHVVLNGVRHVEVLFTLRQMFPDAVKLVYLDAPSDFRQERMVERERIERRLAARYDQDITEAQVSRILPQWADLKVDGTWLLDHQVEKIVDFARKAA